MNRIPPAPDVLDELAAMFLTNTDEPDDGSGDANGPAEPDPKHPASRTPQTHDPSSRNASSGDLAADRTAEILLIGHLPVRGGVWIGPVVDALARARRRSIGLIRLDHERPIVELLGGQQKVPDHELPLSRLIDHCAPRVDAWAVRPAITLTPRDLARTKTARYTLISGADDAAIVAAFRQIKSILIAAEDAGRPQPHFEIVIVGCASERADQMVRRLNAAAEGLLDEPVRLATCLPRIDAEMRTTGPVHCADADCPPLEDVLGWIERAGRSPETEVPPVIETAPFITREPSADSKAPLTPTADAKPAAAPAPNRPRVKIAPKPAATIEEKDSAPHPSHDPGDGEPSLTRAVEGLRPLKPRCPGREAVDLAVDEDGRLHLLTREDHLRDLAFVERWAMLHRDLLTLACPEDGIDFDRPVVRHLLTDRPASVSDLHGSDLRLHVLAPVEVAGRRGWYAAPLNDDGE